AFGIGLAWGSGDWWMQALIASGAPQYGVADPILHRDVGYYVAELPWAETRQSYALLASLTAVVVVSLLYVGIGSLRFRGIRPQASPHARGHLGLLLGCLALVLAWGAAAGAGAGGWERGTTVAGVALAPELPAGAPAWLVASAPDDTALARADPPPDWTAVHRGAWARAGPPLAAVEADTGLATRDV